MKPNELFRPERLVRVAGVDVASLGLVRERFDAFPPLVGHSLCQEKPAGAATVATMTTRAMPMGLLVCTTRRYMPDKCDHYPLWRRPRFSLLELSVWGEKDAEGCIVLPCLHWWDVQDNSRTIVPRSEGSCDVMTPSRFEQVERTVRLQVPSPTVVRSRPYVWSSACS